MKTEIRHVPAPASLTTLSRTAAPVQATASVPRPAWNWKTRLLLPLLILLAFAGMLAYAARDALLPAVDVHVVPVVLKAIADDAANADGAQDEELGTTQTTSAAVVVQAPGWVEPNPFAITVPALAEGVVKEVLVLEGETIEINQIVARLIDEDFQIALRFAQAAIAEREADINRARAAVASAQAGVAVEEANAAALRDDLGRKRELSSAGSFGAAEVRRMELQLKALEARVAQANVAVHQAQSEVAQAEAALQMAMASFAEAELQMQRADIRSPAAGVVLTRLVEPGARISMARGGDGASAMSAGGVVRLYDPARLQVRVDVPLSDAAKIGVGTAAEITTEALPNQTFRGRVIRLVHEANIQRNTVQFKVAIEEPSPLLKPEMLCRVRLNASRIANAGTDVGASGVGAGDLDAMGLQMLLPPEAIFNRAGGKAQVWLVEQHGGSARTTAALRDVTLGTESEEDIVIMTGVKPGDRAIISPSPQLQHGTRVRIVGESLAYADEE